MNKLEINNNKTFVIYSLGNFISDQNDRDNFTGLAFEVTLNKHVDVEDTITNTIIEPKAELIYTTTTKIRGVNHNFKVVPYPNLTDNELANYNQIIILCGHYEGFDERIRTIIQPRVSKS